MTSEKKSAILAVSADIHGDQFLAPSDLSREAALAKEAGAQGFVIAGDIIHMTDSLEKLGEVFDAIKNGASDLPMIVVFGNHDLIVAPQEKLEEVARVHNVTSVDGKRAIARIGNLQIGFTGFNGSAGKSVIDDLQKGNIPKWEWPEILHSITDALYVETFRENVTELENREDVEGIIAVVHFPVTPTQYSDSVEHPYRELSSRYEEIIDASSKVMVVVGGHVHSKKGLSAWRRVDPWAKTVGGTPALNKAMPTALQEGDKVFELVELRAGKYARPLRRLSSMNSA